MPVKLRQVFIVARDLDATLVVLTAQGHVTRGVRDMGAHGRTAGVEDPGGGFIVLFQHAG